MALAPITPRDRLQRLVDLGRKAVRYWWLIAVFGVVGGALSLGFALTRGKRFESWSVLFYQERIQSSILTNGRQEEVQRNLGDRFRELLLARQQLAQIVNDPKLDPYPGTDPDLAIDKLRTAVRFEVRGGNNFRITYGDGDPDRAKAVTEKLTKMLQEKDESLRNEQAQMTVQFVTQQKEEASLELRKREQALVEFLAKHPEFAQDQISAEGAGIRAIRNSSKTAPVNSGNPKLYALERQRQRIQARLDAPPDQPVQPIKSAPSPERLAADAQVADAQRELTSANKELEDALGKFTDKHPAVIKAQERVAAAQQKLRHAQAAVPPDDNTPLPPATPADRSKLQKELQQIEGQIADEQRNGAAAPKTGSGTGSGSAAADPTTSANWVVDLETKYAELKRAHDEQRERVGSLADSVFRAQIDASQKSAEAGGRLSVVDPAFKPVRPSGPGKTVFLLAGMVLFVALGATIAIGLAILDDRLYRRDDIDALDIPVLAVIPPIAIVQHHKKKAA
ncbi:MAG: hypothetical protein QM831_24455 [Kofleriaceae bacterium]